MIFWQLYNNLSSKNIIYITQTECFFWGGGIKDKKLTITKHVCVLKFEIILDDLKSQNLALCFIH